jgi:hypothetical protein
MSIDYKLREKVPTSQVGYVSSGKEYEGSERRDDTRFAYWKLAEEIENIFGQAPATVEEIYHQMTGPKYKLSASDTYILIKAAVTAGYLEKA